MVSFLLSICIASGLVSVLSWRIYKAYSDLIDEYESRSLPLEYDSFFSFTKELTSSDDSFVLKSRDDQVKAIKARARKMYRGGSKTVMIVLGLGILILAPLEVFLFFWLNLRG